MRVIIEKLSLHINRLQDIGSGYSEQNAEILSEVFFELHCIISSLISEDQSKWGSIYTGIMHTKDHIQDLDSKVSKSRVEGYKLGYEQILGDLEEIKDRLLD